MDFPWIEVGALLGGQAILFTLYDRIKYRRQLKRDKDAETKKNEAEAKKNEIEAQQEDILLQDKKIDVGDKFMSKVLEWSEKTYNATVKNNTDIHERVDGLAQQMAEFSGQLSQLSTKVDSVDDRLVKVESKVDSIDNRLSTVETKVDSLDFRLTTVEANLAILSEHYADMEGFLNGQYQEHLKTLGKTPKEIQAKVRTIKAASRAKTTKSKKITKIV